MWHDDLCNKLQLITAFFYQLEETVAGGQWMSLCGKVWMHTMQIEAKDSIFFFGGGVRNVQCFLYKHNTITIQFCLES